MGTVDAKFPRHAQWRFGPLRGFAVLLLAIVLALGGASSAVADFGISEFTVTARNADGTIDGIAATHPFALVVHFGMNADDKGEPEGVLGGVRVDLPPGLLGNSLNVPRCSAADFEGSAPSCAGSTQVGIFRGVIARTGEVNAPVYNLAPTPGAVAAFGISLNGESFVQRLSVIGNGAAGAVRLSGSPPAGQRIVDVEEELWGVPADPAHDSERICQQAGGGIVQGCSADSEERPLLTLPASCAGPLSTTVTATSLGPPAVSATATALSRDAGGNPLTLIECEAVPFYPRFSVQTEAAAMLPTGLSLDLEVPQYEGVGLRASAAVESVRIELPEGVALNPSAGAWLAGCGPAAIGLETAPGVQPPVFSEDPVSCPDASRLGSVILRTPMVGRPLSGAIYLAAPAANPFAARYAVYLVIEDAATGTVLKVPGRLDADSGDGRLTVTVPEMPQLPFSELQLEFANGPRAPLAGPPSCGRYSAKATLTPSTAPFGPAVVRSSTFTISTGSHGTPCPAPEADRNATPSFRAGTEVARAGGDSPLVVDLSREDLDQHFGSFALTLPPGLIADLGSTPVGTAVGGVQVQAGLGSQPLALDGTVYLGGPYEGAPYSLEIVVPAKVGPFDLGTIVQRAAVSVDPVTAQIGVRADPLPQILAGVPLELRSLTLDLDRPGFVRNPTSCEPMAIGGSATSSLGQSAPLSARFQVGDCAKLPFKPKLGLRLSGALGRNGHPALRAVLSGDPQGAALASVGFSLPADELLDLRHLRRLCPRGVAPASCPSDSRLGELRLESPFLDGPVKGPVYIRVPSHRLPDFSAELRSGRLRFVLDGRATSSNGRFGVGFGSLPDIPLSKAVLSLPGGRGGIVVNSRSLCSGPGTVTATAAAHNGMRRTMRVAPRLAGRC